MKSVQSEKGVNPMSNDKKESEGKKLSRRDFLRNTGLIAGGAAIGGTFLAGCASDTTAPAQQTSSEQQWDLVADVVVIGAGGAGLPAALKAQAEGASVLIVEANWDIGGHAAVSGGNLHSGGGTAIQKKYGIQDSPDQYYIDHTTNLTYVSRYNDREVVRATANAMPEAFQFILDNGVLIYDRAPTKPKSYLEGGTSPESIARDTLVDSVTLNWVNYFSGLGTNGGPARAGIGLVRPLEKTAREKGIRFLLNYHMDKLFREEQLAGRVMGIEASYTPTILPGENTPLKSLNSNGNVEMTKEKVTIKANKGIVIATGGHTSNVSFRTLFDPRLTEEYDGVAGEPFSLQDASGELAAMAIGASLGTAANQVQESGAAITQPSYIGCRYGYRNAATFPTSPIFKLIGATGLSCTSYEDVILVNMLGKRFWSEDDSQSYDYFAAAMSSVIIGGEDPTDARRIGGPIWAIFDADTVARRKWNVAPPNVDIADGRFFSGKTLEELAQNIVNKYYKDIKMDPKTLVDTIAKYNSYVDAKKDAEFGKKTLDFKIQTGPFYAAWATPCLHDTLTGLRVNGKQNVLDIYGKPIPGLYCGGESAAGQSVHGLGRVITSGYIAGASAAKGL